MSVAGGRGRLAGTKRGEYHLLLVETLPATSLPAASRLYAPNLRPLRRKQRHSRLLYEKSATL